MTPETTTAPAVDQQRLVGPYRELDPKVELPKWCDEYKWHRDDNAWNQTGRDATAADVSGPHYPKIWRTRRPACRPNAEVGDGGPLTHDKPAAQSRRSLH